MRLRNPFRRSSPVPGPSLRRAVFARCSFWIIFETMSAQELQGFGSMFRPHRASDDPESSALDSSYSIGQLFSAWQWIATLR